MEPQDQSNKEVAPVDERTRAQARKQLHERKVAERKATAEQLKADYLGEKDSPVVADILAKSRQFAAYHLKLAKDGVGAKQVGVDDSNAPIIEDYVLTPEMRISELDQCKGLEQLISYIEQKLA